MCFEDKKWIVDYLSGGKGVIPYETIKEWEDFNIRPNPNEIFFSKTSFYSSLNKAMMVTDEQYKDIKKLFTKMKMNNISDLNAL